MHSTTHEHRQKRISTLVRVTLLLAFWLILSGFSAADLPTGILAAAAATWVSLRLVPPGQLRPRFALICWLMLRFLYQSVVAGFDVARRALDPRLPLQPGIVIYRSKSPPGVYRSAFCTTASLQPGLLPSGFNEDDDVVVHCLDVRQPVARLLAEEEVRFLEAIGAEHGHD